MSSKDPKGLLQRAYQQGSDTPKTYGVLCRFFFAVTTGKLIPCSIDSNSPLFA